MTQIAMRPAGLEVLRLHAFLHASTANGPGTRAVIWVQGCTLDCTGCYNPQTHPSGGGEAAPVGELLERIRSLAGAIEGITVSGGEPLQQPRPLQALLERVRRETALSCLLFSGYTWEEIQRLPQGKSILANVDVLIAGRYDAAQRLGYGLLGSANQSVHFLTARYSMADLQAVSSAEVAITASGEVILSGIDPLAWV